MATWELLLALLIAANALHGAQRQSLDCNGPRLFGPDELTKCCDIELARFDRLTVCPEFIIKSKRPKHIASVREFLECTMDCIMNSTGALENGRLNLINLRELLNQLSDSNPIVVNVHLEAFVQCETEMLQKTHSPGGVRFNVNGGLQIAIRKCPQLALELTECAERVVQLNCPASYWRATAECEAAKEYERNCPNNSASRDRMF